MQGRYVIDSSSPLLKFTMNNITLNANPPYIYRCGMCYIGSGDHKVVTTGEDLDVDAAISQELESLKKKPSRRRFQALDSGAKNVVFIQCEDVVCPNELVHFMLTDIAATRVPCTRYV